MEGEEAVIRKEGDWLIVKPVRKGRLLLLLNRLPPLIEPFPDIDDDTALTYLPGIVFKLVCLMRDSAGMFKPLCSLRIMFKVRERLRLSTS